MFYNKFGDIMERLIFHIDVNNAFLSWTAVDMLKKGAKLDIRTIPAIIGGDESKRHGVVLAKSNVAKQFGIKTGEPIYFARKKCTNLEVFESNHKMYREYSNKLYELFKEYTNIIERFSIDECFLDMTNFIGKNENYLSIAKEISIRIKEELGFTVNIGIAHNKLLAKMASDFEKPDKIHTLWTDEIKIKMWPLKVSELLMVGRKSIPKLEKMGIKTIGDLANYNKEVLYKTFGKFGKTIWEYANGIDNSPVNYIEEKPKGIGNSITVPQDLTNINEINSVVIKVEGVVLKELPNSKRKLPASLDRTYGINEYYDISSVNNVDSYTVYYVSSYNNNEYYVPVTKYINNADNDKVKIIIDELSSSPIHETNLMSFLSANASLINYEQDGDILKLNFNDAILENKSSNKILEEVIYTISLSVKDNYDVEEVSFLVNDKEIYKNSLKSVE